MSIDTLESLRLEGLDVLLAASQGCALMRDAMRELDQAVTPLGFATGAQYLTATATALYELAAMAKTLAAKTENAAHCLAIDSGFVRPTSAE
jgi:hypothetical protein